MGGGLMQLVAFGPRVQDGGGLMQFFPVPPFTTVEGRTYTETAVIQYPNGKLLKNVKGGSFNITDGSLGEF